MVQKRVFSRTFSTFPGVLAEAFSSWNWYNYLASKAPPAKRLLRVNIDETSVSLWQGSGKGTIAFARRGDAEHEAHQSVPRRLKRMNMTHVAFICDAADLQPKMPQIFIGNAAIFKVSDIRVLNAEAPDNILFVRQKSSWNNSFLFRKILKLFVDLLGPNFSLLFYVIMLFDACRQHLNEDTLAYMKSLGLHLCLIPARLTWLLQPLDTHAFQLYKNLLRSIYAEARCASPSGSLSTIEFSRLLFRVVRQCLQGRLWAQAFDSDGFGSRQQLISKYVKKQLQLQAPPNLPLHKPAAKELQKAWPRNMAVPYHLVVPKATQLLALPPPPPLAALALPRGPPKPPMARPVLPPAPERIAPALPPSPPAKPPLVAKHFSSSASSWEPAPRRPKPPPRRRVLPWQPRIPENLEKHG